MVEEPARNGRRPTGRPGEPRIGFALYDGGSNDDIAYCADPASMPRAKSDVGERELSAPFCDLGNITCGAAQPAAAFHGLLAADRQRKHLEALARIAQRESPEDGLRWRHEANPKRLQTQTKTRSRSDRRAGNRKPSGVYSSRSYRQFGGNFGVLPP